MKPSKMCCVPPAPSPTHPGFGPNPSVPVPALLRHSSFFELSKCSFCSFLADFRKALSHSDLPSYHFGKVLSKSISYSLHALISLSVCLESQELRNTAGVYPAQDHLSVQTLACDVMATWACHVALWSRGKLSVWSLMKVQARNSATKSHLTWKYSLFSSSNIVCMYVSTTQHFTQEWCKHRFLI